MPRDLISASQDAHGPDPDAMRSARISAEELFSQLRLKDVTDIADVSYAILEPNGQISVIEKSTSQQNNQKNKKETGMMHLVIADGRLNQKNLAMAGKTEAWADRFLAVQGVTRRDVFMLTVDDAGNTRLHLRKKS